jgi:hypothetical protein
VATLYIAEYPGEGHGGGTGIVLLPFAPEPPLVEQTVAISGTSAASNSFSASTALIRVHTDSICSILVGSSPVATTTNKRLAADTTEYFAVTPGAKISVIANT